MAASDLTFLLSSCEHTLFYVGLSGLPATRVTVKEDDDVILPCSLGTSVNIELMLFDWKKEGTVPRKEVFMYDPDNLNTPYRGQDEQFRGRVSHFPGELKQGNASIRINKTRLEDKGTYTCLFPRAQPSEKVFTLELVVGECCYESPDSLQMKQSAHVAGPAVVSAVKQTFPCSSCTCLHIKDLRCSQSAQNHIKSQEMQQ